MNEIIVAGDKLVETYNLSGEIVFAELIDPTYVDRSGKTPKSYYYPTSWVRTIRFDLKAKLVYWPGSDRPEVLDRNMIGWGLEGNGAKPGALRYLSICPFCGEEIEGDEFFCKRHLLLHGFAWDGNPFYERLVDSDGNRIKIFIS